MTFFQLVAICYVFRFMKSLEQSLCTAQPTQHTTENNTCIISHAQNTTELKPNVFLTGIQRLLFTNNGDQFQNFYLPISLHAEPLKMLLGTLVGKLWSALLTAISNTKVELSAS